jgi:hypothetical protein
MQMPRVIGVGSPEAYCGVPGRSPCSIKWKSCRRSQSADYAAQRGEAPASASGAHGQTVPKLQRCNAICPLPYYAGPSKCEPNFGGLRSLGTHLAEAATGKLHGCIRADPLIGTSAAKQATRDSGEASHPLPGHSTIAERTRPTYKLLPFQP